ncbi:MAG: hypothetical protein Q8L47_03855 [bacterium]|nr:hypothetical protein [bacterium]
MWAFKRQLFYLAVVIAFIGGLAFLIAYPYFNKTPTCIDGKQNGTETGVDCGGICQLACIAEVDQISILWSRIFRVVPGRYNAIAYLENKNENTAIYRIKYRFRFADKDNIYIGKREGETYVLPKGKFAVFEPAIDVGNSIPIYTTFEFTEVPNWIQVSKKEVDQLKIFVSDIKLENENTEPKLSAVVKNNSLFRIPEVSFVVILYDVLGNAISASHTYLDVLKGEESANINFTWREPILTPVIAKEIIPMFNIFLVKLK